MGTPSLSASSTLHRSPSRDTLEILEVRRGMDLKDEDVTAQVRRADLDELTAHMVATPERSTALFRRFDHANLRELLEMEREIAELDAAIAEEQARPTVDEHAVRKMRREMRGVMKEYYESMLLTQKILALPHPPFPLLNTTRAAFPATTTSPPHLYAKYHNPTNFPDLTCLAPPPPTDLLSRLGTRSAHLASFLSAACAVLFLVGGMVGLYFVASMRARLGLVGMLTVLFAGVMAGVTGGKGRRGEVFVATAAYAAVLVVFVSGNISSNPAPTTCVFAPNGNANSNANANPYPYPYPFNPSSTVADPASTTHATATTALSTALSTILPSLPLSLPTPSSPLTNLSTLSTLPSPAFTTTATTTATITTTPTIITKHIELSGLAKTGIGIGATIGTFFLLMMAGGMVMWVKQQVWFAEGGWFRFSGWGRRRGDDTEGTEWARESEDGGNESAGDGEEGGGKRGWRGWRGWLGAVAMWKRKRDAVKKESRECDGGSVISGAARDVVVGGDVEKEVEKGKGKARVSVEIAEKDERGECV